MWGNDEIIRRLGRVEDHFASCDEREMRAQITATNNTAKLNEVVKFFEDFISNHKTDAANKSRREDDLANKHLSALQSIQTDINQLKQEVASHPKDVSLLLLKFKEEISTNLSEEYVEKEDHSSFVKSMRIQLKVIWTMNGIFFVSYFGNNKVFSLISKLF